MNKHICTWQITTSKCKASFTVSHCKWWSIKFLIPALPFNESVRTLGRFIFFEGEGIDGNRGGWKSPVHERRLYYLKHQGFFVCLSGTKCLFRFPKSDSQMPVHYFQSERDTVRWASSVAVFVSTVILLFFIMVRSVFMRKWWFIMIPVKKGTLTLKCHLKCCLLEFRLKKETSISKLTWHTWWDCTCSTLYFPCP